MAKEVTELSNLNIRYFKTADDVAASTDVGENDICFTEELDSVDWGNITGDIENQSDLINKLNTKVDKVEGKTLSTNDFTDNDKLLLDNLDAIYARRIELEAKQDTLNIAEISGDNW